MNICKTTKTAGQVIGNTLQNQPFLCINSLWSGLGGWWHFPDADPLFADTANGDCHLKSQAGRWDPQMQSWIQDDVTSPCIDAGDPNSDWSAELSHHGERINLGVYGGTSHASKSFGNGQ